MNESVKTDLIPLRKVVEQGFCVGCGACSYATGVRMQVNRYGEYIPALEKADDSILSGEEVERVCPSLRPDLNEDVIARELFSENAVHDMQIGYHLASYAAFVKEGDYREKGTSGGMGTWVATELFRKRLIDGVIHVKAQHRSNLQDPFYSYGLSESLEEICAAARTRYHVVEISEVLNLIKEKEGRYLFIGVPCISKSIRRLQQLDHVLQKKIPFVFSLVCGHLKSINWSLSLAWGADIKPNEAGAIQYRTKGDGIPARAYVFRASDKAGKTTQKNSADVTGGKFNAGALMLPACDYCDDVVGETADLTIGDAWIPRFEVDEGGTNLLVVRNRLIQSLLEEALANDRIMLTPISAHEAAESQSGGFRQRREGLSYRLEKARKKGIWVPQKRVAPGQIPLPSTRKHIYDLRTEVTLRSRAAFAEALEKQDYLIYQKTMNTLLKKARLTELRSSFFRLAWNKLKRVILSRLAPVKRKTSSGAPK